MAEVREVQLEVLDQEGKGNSSEQTIGTNIRAVGSRNYKWWLLRIFIYTVFMIGGQAAALIMGRLYFIKGGSSKWLGTLVQVVGFPILLPIYFLLSDPNNTTKTELDSNSITTTTTDEPSFLRKLKLVYLPLGLLTAANSFMYTVGFQYLPVSTVTLVTASQLGFTALFSFWFNAEKITPYVINSIVLLTISSVLLVINDISSRPPGVSKGKYAAGFVCTVIGAVGFGMLFPAQQLAFRKVLKKKSLKVILDVIVFELLVATGPILVGLFASGEWKGLHAEMDRYTLGKASYVLTLVWTAIIWQIFGIGALGIIYEMSSLYSNAVATVGLPIVPIIAIFVFDEKFTGIKGMALVLAIWGFISYLYQHYLDHQKSRIDNRVASDIHEHFPPQ